MVRGVSTGREGDVPVHAPLGVLVQIAADIPQQIEVASSKHATFEQNPGFHLISEECICTNDKKVLAQKQVRAERWPPLWGRD